MRRPRVIAAALLALAIAAARPAFADIAVRVQRPLDLVALPLIVMEHEHLIERTAEAMGLGKVTVTWNAPGKADPIEALTAGQSDLAAVNLAPFLLAADNTAGKPDEVRALAALVGRPYVLVTRNPAIKTIRDFTAKDRIAVPALKISGPALMLEMAAAQEWGIEHYDKLDPLVVARPDADAAAALISGKGDVDAHVSRTPYVDDELGDRSIHRVMDSFDIAGPHSAAVLAATMRFQAANPELCKAILSALQAADDLIKQSPGEAAEMFAAAVKDESMSIEDLTDMVGDPDLSYTAAPAGVMRLADFMHRVGRLKRPPKTWQDLFLPAARDLAGN
ncbi:MAG TPA: ABC transporter substrate-binding protein [Stellaceae bacterium]|nr:ABC transporter substrate-binding protein [Stellaceae bacterium]